MQDQGREVVAGAINSKWAEPFSRSLPPAFQYFRIEATKYQDKEIGDVQFIYDRQEFKITQNIIYKYCEETEVSTYLKICLKVQANDQNKSWLPLKQSYRVQKWIKELNLMYASIINLRVEIRKVLQSQIREEGADLLHDRKYFQFLSQQPIEIGLFTQDKGLVFHSFKEGQPISKFLPKNANLQEYQFFMMSFSKEAKIKPSFTTSKLTSQGQRYLDRGSVVRISPKGVKLAAKRKPNLIIRGSDVSIRINYEEYKHFRCENIVKMTNLIMVQTYAMLYNQILLTPKETLSKLALQNFEGTAQIRLMDPADIFCWLLDTNTTYEDFLEDQTLLQVNENIKQSEQHVKDLHQTIKKIEETLEKTRENPDNEVTKYFPDFIYKRNFFKSITAYTMQNYFEFINKQLRQKRILQLIKSKKTSQICRCALILTRNLHSLPYELMLNQENSQQGNQQQKKMKAYRGDQFHYAIFKNTVITSFSFLSFSKDENKALHFGNKGQDKFYTIFQTSHYSGRYVQPFTAVQQEKEVLFSCLSKFIVKDIKKIGYEIRVILEELPSVKDIGNKHFIWIDKNVNEGIQLVNKIRALKKQSDPYFYVQTDIMPFRSNEILKIWLEHFAYWSIPKEKTVVIFTIQDKAEREQRVQFIKANFPAALYICLRNSQESRSYFERSQTKLHPLFFCEASEQIAEHISKLPEFSPIRVSQLSQGSNSCSICQSCQLI